MSKILTTITLGTAWTGSGPYTQAAGVEGVSLTAASKVDIRQDADVMTALAADKVRGLYIININGSLTAVAVGAVPTTAVTLPVTVTETGGAT